MQITIQKTMPGVAYSVNKVEFQAFSYEEFNDQFPLVKKIMARIDKFEDDLVNDLTGNPVDVMQAELENKELVKLTNNLQIESAQKTVLIKHMKEALGEGAEVIITQAKESEDMARTTLHSEIED